MKRKLKKLITTILCMCVIFSCININVMADIKEPMAAEEQKFKTPEELKKSFEEEKNKTDKFIIKYKTDKSKSFSKANVLKTKSVKVKGNEEIIIKSNSDESMEDNPEQLFQIVSLEESVDIDDFISDELRANNEIEYIQPDYILEISELAQINDSTGIFNQAYPENTILIDLIPDMDIGSEMEAETDAENESETDIKADADNESEIESDADNESETDIKANEDNESETDIKANEDNESETDIELNPEFDEQLPSDDSEKIIVAILDTGIDINHQDLKDNIFVNESETDDGTDSDDNGYIDDINGWNFVDKNNTVYNEKFGVSEQAHGTQISGIVSGVTPKDYGMQRDENVIILPLKVFSNGKAYTSDIIDAINYAEMMGAKIINCSFGSTYYNVALKEAMENSNCLFVCAAGNGRNNLDEKPVYPAAFGLDNIISVASVNDDGGLSYFSNYGVETVDIAAIGREIESTIPEGSYGANTGTSMSAAFVSGTAARILSENSELDANGIKNQIIDGADKISTLEDYVNKAARLNSVYAILGIDNSQMKNITAVEDFNVTGYSSDEEQMKLFAVSKNIAIACGGYHTLVLKDDGTVWAWGDNSFGQLGNVGFGGYSQIPTQVYGLSNIIKIAAGETSSMALDADGNIWTWGGNNYGQLGLGNYGDTCYPMQVYIWEKIEDIAMSNHCVVTTKNQSILTWGNNDYNQLSLDGVTQCPYPCSLDPYAIKISCGYTLTIMKHWYNNLAAIGNHFRPYKFDPLYYFENEIYNTATEFSAGNRYNLVWAQNGDIYELDNSYGGFENELVITNANNVKKLVSSIGNTNFMLLEDGNVWAWGENYGGTFGNGWVASKWRTYDPTEVFIDNVADISCGYNHAIAVDKYGNIWGWGTDYLGNLGPDYDYSYEPRKLFGSVPDENLFDLVFNTANSNTYSIALTAANVTSFNNRLFTVTYDPQKLQLMDLASQTQKGSTAIGKIEGTDLTIVSNTGGVITFKAEKQIPSGMAWSGALTIIKFKAVSTAECTVKVKLS